jgi:predicted N-formylglutamate amidohydrolase
MLRPEVGLLLTSEHGGNRIPHRWVALFKQHRALLESHRGWDPGALTLARALSKAMLLRSGDFDAVTRALTRTER